MEKFGLDFVKFKVNRLDVSVYEDRKKMGEAAAEEFHKAVVKKLGEKNVVNVVFAAAPSQSDFLEALRIYKDIEWDRINVFHMDEYVGISIEQEQSFARFVKTYVADMFNVRSFHALNGKNYDIEAECERYAKLLEENKIDIVCCGIGENGHIAFNDPGEADFFDSKVVKVVELDEVCRKQQVNDGCFKTLNDVPKQAMTLTIPALLRADQLICIVPCLTKAKAVRATLKEEISVDCPASIMRIHKNASLFCDKNSVSEL